MIESRSQTGHRRKMISSQPSAQSVARLSGPAETETKRIVSHRGSASGFDRPRSSSEAEPRLLKKNPTERNITSYLQGAGHDPGYWPVISLFSIEDHVHSNQRPLPDFLSTDFHTEENSEQISSIHSWRRVTWRQWQVACLFSKRRSRESPAGKNWRSV
jgi:hypothetical protein